MRGGVPLSARLAGVLAAAASGAGVSVLTGVAAAAAAPSLETRKIYGAENIKRYLQRRKPSYGSGSGANRWPANGEREIARRLRQQARDAERQQSRAEARGAYDRVHRSGQIVLGISRRGRYLFA